MQILYSKLSYNYLHMSLSSYNQKKQKIIDQFSELSCGPGSGSVRLSKTTSNLFRTRTSSKLKSLDVRSLNTVIKIDVNDMAVEVEGMTTFEDLVDATLLHGMIPLVVPELKTITIGGGVSGLAIESSSFKYGLAHESVQEMDVLLASGKVVTCTSDNEYKDLFYGLPNSYGTLGYILKVTTKLRKVAPYIQLKHLRFNNPKSYFKELNTISTTKKYDGQAVDFIDGTIFGPDELYITLGFDVDQAPYISDYTGKQIYYQSIRERDEDYLTIYDYIWRWDTDWFWCSRIIKADKPLVRRLLGKKHLNSRTYSKLLHLENHYHIGKWIAKMQRNKLGESIIQDVQVPILNAEKFFSFFQTKIGIKPVWVCPTKAKTKDWPYSLYPMDPSSLYINFGFWDSVQTTMDPDEGYFNKLIEHKVESLSGMKSLYSTSYYKRSNFEDLYNYPAHRKLKQSYDKTARFKDLYEKCVLRQ
jgi:FAD/FMN-containing dehydrogenase